MIQGVSPTALFDRNWSVTLAPTNSKGEVLTERGFQFKKGPQKGLYTAESTIRVSFEVEKTEFGSSNKGRITLYNLSAASRLIYAEGAQLRLQVGYGDNLSTLFDGWCAKVYNKNTGAELATVFEAGEGEHSLRVKVLDKAYPSGTSEKTLIMDLVDALELPKGVIKGLPTSNINTSFTASGPIRSQLDTLCKKHSLKWSIQNGQIQILPVGETNGAVAELITADTGLIGNPSVGNGSTVSFSSLLNPRLYPGTPVLLQSNLTNDKRFLFKITKASFSGDSHGDKWQVDCEATRMDKPIGTSAITGKSYQEQLNA